MEHGYRGFSFTAARLAKLGYLTSPQLMRCQSVVSSLKILMTQVSVKVERSDGPPAPLELDDNGLSSTGPYEQFPFFDRLLRIESVDHLALPRRPILKQVPVDYLRIPSVATTIEEALIALHHADRVCMLLVMRNPRRMNHAFICSLLENVFFTVLPVPLCKKTRSNLGKESIWSSSVTYSFQLDLLVVLHRLFCHYMCSLEHYQQSESRCLLRRLLTLFCMTAIADCILRKRATDLPRYLFIILLTNCFFSTSFI